MTTPPTSPTGAAPASPTTTDVLILVGSLRDGSWNRRLAQHVADRLPDGATATLFDRLGDVPHYRDDLDGDEPPAVVTELRDAARAARALVVVTPEYNGSISGVVKDAIDWLSRPRGASALDGLPAAVLAASPSPRGAQWAREHAQRVLGVAGAAVLDDTHGVGAVADAFGDDGLLEDEATAVATLVDRLLEAAATADRTTAA